jgi:hypothetical protein
MTSSGSSGEQILKFKYGFTWPAEGFRREWFIKAKAPPCSRGASGLGLLLVSSESAYPWLVVKDFLPDLFETDLLKVSK